MSEIIYMTETEEQTKVDTIVWSSPDLYIAEEYRIENPKEANTEIASQFSVKVKLLDHDYNVMEIYFKSSEPITSLTVSLIKGRSILVDQRICKSVQRSKWLYLYKYVQNSSLKQLSEPLKFTCEFKFTYINTEDSFSISKGQLNNDVANIFNSNIFTDTIIKSAEGKEFNVHKAILAGRSEVLKANFEYNTIECDSNIVGSPFEADVLEEVLKFIYSDEAMVDDMPAQLLAAADYYQLCGLKCVCEESLFKKLTKENAIDTLQLAELYSAKTLKQMTLEFIKDDYTKTIFKTEGWSNIKSVELLKELCEYIVSDNS